MWYTVRSSFLLAQSHYFWDVNEAAIFIVGVVKYVTVELDNELLSQNRQEMISTQEAHSLFNKHWQTIHIIFNNNCAYFDLIWTKMTELNTIVW